MKIWGTAYANNFDNLDETQHSQRYKLQKLAEEKREIQKVYIYNRNYF